MACIVIQLRKLPLQVSVRPAAVHLYWAVAVATGAKWLTSAATSVPCT